MELKVSQLDLQKTAENWPADLPFKPALMLKQPVMQPDDWWIADAPIVPGTPPTWASAGHDQYVRIPLFSYNLNPAADLAFAFMLQLGLSCAGYLPGRVKKFHVVTGSPVDLLRGEGINTAIALRYWVGVAVVTDKGA